MTAAATNPSLQILAHATIAERIRCARLLQRVYRGHNGFESALEQKRRRECATLLQVKCVVLRSLLVWLYFSCMLSAHDSVFHGNGSNK